LPDPQVPSMVMVMFLSFMFIGDSYKKSV